MKQHFFLILCTSMPVHAVTIANSFIYHQPDGIIIWETKAQNYTFTTHALTKSEKTMTISAARKGIKLTRQRDPSKAWNISFRALGCSLAGQPVPPHPDYPLNSDAYGSPRNIHFNHTVYAHDRIGIVQPMGYLNTLPLSSGSVPGYNILTPEITLYRQELRKIYGYTVRDGDYPFECNYEILQEDELLFSIRNSIVFNVKTYGGTTVDAGFAPDVLHVAADPHTGQFEANTTLTIPAVQLGTLTLRSDKPIRVDLGAGLSPASTIVSTTFSATGTARGAVRILGETTTSGLSTYNILAESTIM